MSQKDSCPRITVGAAGLEPATARRKAGRPRRSTCVRLSMSTCGGSRPDTMRVHAHPCGLWTVNGRLILVVQVPGSGRGHTTEITPTGRSILPSQASASKCPRSGFLLRRRYPHPPAGRRAASMVRRGPPLLQVRGSPADPRANDEPIRLIGSSPNSCWRIHFSSFCAELSWSSWVTLPGVCCSVHMGPYRCTASGHALATHGRATATRSRCALAPSSLSPLKFGVEVV